jgi:hypothetical protein
MDYTLGPLLFYRADKRMVASSTSYPTMTEAAAARSLFLAFAS